MNQHEDLGPPAVELRELREEPDQGFMNRIRGSIHRRLFVADAADFTFFVFFETLFDYLDLFMRSILGAPTPPANDREHD